MACPLILSHVYSLPKKASWKSDDALWDEHHHRFYFVDITEDNLSGVYLTNFVKPFMNSIFIHEIESEKNLSIIEEMIPLDISIKPGIVENIYISVSSQFSVLNFST